MLGGVLCFTRGGRCGRLFATDLTGGLVFAQAVERGLADEVVGTPCGEVNLGDELGLDPDGSVARVGRHGFEGCRVATELVEARAQVGMNFTGEAGASASRVNELALLVVAEEQRSDSIDVVRGQGEAADDQLLFVDALELAPVGTAIRDVFAVGAL